MVVDCHISAQALGAARPGDVVEIPEGEWWVTGGIHASELTGRVQTNSQAHHALRLPSHCFYNHLTGVTLSCIGTLHAKDDMEIWPMMTGKRRLNTETFWPTTPYNLYSGP